MTRQQIIEVIKNGGYIRQTEGYLPKVYDHNGAQVASCPVATMERIADENGMTQWLNEWNDAFICKENGEKHNDHENTAHCKYIADNIADYVNGNVHKCPECGEVHTIPDEAEKYLCSCGFLGDIDDYEQLSIYDFFEDCYDIEYRIGSDKELRSVQIMVACGGPNIYIDTASKKVELYWWTEKADYPLSYESVEAIDEWAEELYFI
jgi:predicted RNA-binding Zn-ribbon protein involved in translation (DUF1610 family)